MNSEDDRSGAGRVTMAEVGRIAGVSQVTVSRALATPSKVSPETLRRIHAAIKATGFVPNALAGALASNRSRLVSALIPSLTNIVYAAFVTTFGARLHSEGYQLLLSETGFDPEDEARLIATHLSRRPDAVLLTGIDHSPQARRMLQAAGVPVAEIWDLTEDPIDLCVGFSHEEASRSVARLLHAERHRRAATITASDSRATRRRDAFTGEFRALAQTNVAAVDIGGPASLGAGRRALARLLDDHGFASGAIFCSSDLLAHGVLIEAAARGIAVPEQIAVMGFGDQELAADVTPALSTVKVDRNRLGQLAADHLLARLEGLQPPAITDVGFEIIRRDSC